MVEVVERRYPERWVRRGEEGHGGRVEFGNPWSQ